MRTVQVERTEKRNVIQKLILVLCHPLAQSETCVEKTDRTIVFITILLELLVVNMIGKELLLNLVQLMENVAT